MNLAQLLHRQALTRPHAPAIRLGTRVISDHAAWADRAAHVAQRLRQAGLVPGDRVALFMHNHHRILDLMLGAWWAGMAVVPINAKLHPLEARWIIDDARAGCVFTTAGEDRSSMATAFEGLSLVVEVDSPEAAAWWSAHGGEGRERPVERAGDDLAWLFYTSGTTGRPKGVMITHRNLRTMGMGYVVDVDPITSHDRIVYAAPMSHGNGLYAIPHLMAGATHVVPASGGFDADELFELGMALGPLSLFAAPTIVNRLVACAERRGFTPDDCARAFKTIVYGGAPMYEADIRRALSVMGPRFVQIYGQGESPMTGTVLSREHLGDVTHPRHADRLASIGVAQTPVDLRIVDEQGREQAHGQVGEVVLRGDAVMAGYWQRPDATAQAIRDGWLWTGDLGVQDADGFVTLKDRSKDLIISGGTNIYPREVEEVLLQSPDVAAVAVVGEPDAEWGESVAAFVVRHPGREVQADDLDAWCLARMARFKRPKRYVFVASLPQNHYGKVLKTELRDRLRGGPASAGS